MPICGMCGVGSTRIVQTLKGTFLLCGGCEPPVDAGPAVLALSITAESPRFKLPPLPLRKFNLPALPKRQPKRVVVAPQSRHVVKCVVDYTYAENESGNEQECVVVECGECGHTEQSWGHGDKSVRRCLVLMGKNCPEDADDNFYAIEGDE